MEERNKDQQKEIEKIKKELKEERKKTEEYLNGWKRAKADYLNLEREIKEEKAEWIKIANQEFILKFLPILDSFNKLVERLPKEEKSEWAKGVLQVKRQIENFLKEIGLERIKTINEKFNPEFHEIVEKKGENGKIIKEVSSGYLLEEEVIRPAKVIID